MPQVHGCFSFKKENKKQSDFLGEGGRGGGVPINLIIQHLEEVVNAFFGRLLQIIFKIQKR